MIVLLLACTAVDEARTGADAADDSDSGTEIHPAELEDVLARLRKDRDGTILDVANTLGWPLSVEGGRLFVASGARTTELAGDFDGWAGAEMQPEDDFSWAVVDATGGYKFVRRSTYEADPWSRAYTTDEFGELSLSGPAEPHLERLFSVGNDDMVARTIRAWIPTAPTRTLYVHDGQNLFDPSAMWGGWHLQDSAPTDILLVGIDNTADRMEEYTHVSDTLDGDVVGGRGDEYASFVSDTVRPLVQGTWGEPGPVGTMGSSLGGLISFHIAHRQPEEWAFAASLSGTMGWGSIGAEHETMIQRYAAADHGSAVLYLDSGGDGDCYDTDGDGTNDDNDDAGDNYCENIQLRETLAGVGYTYDVDLFHWWEPNAEHNEMAWAERVFRPMDIFDAL